MTSRLLADRYRLGDEIGRGGMSVVVEAIDERLGRKVAVKLLELDGASLPDAIERFRREAQIAASLNHPNIVSVYDTGVDGATAFLVMELLPGPTLAHKVASREKLALSEVVDVAQQVCLALTAANTAGVVHRDIKPSNIAYADSKTVKVLDFGVARLIEATTGQTELTRTSMVIGTASYLSPEQARGDPVTPQTDLYALGCVLFTLVSGGPPFHGENALVVCSQHLHAEAPHLTDLAPGVSPALSALVDDLLEKDPARRPAGAEVVGRRLASIVASDPGNDLTVPLRVSDDLTSTREYPADATGPPQLRRPQVSLEPIRTRGVDAIRAFSSSVQKWARRLAPRPRWVLGVVLAVALIIIIIVVLLATNSGTPPASPAPAITIPPPVPGFPPLPEPLVRSLDDLARAVNS